MDIRLLDIVGLLLKLKQIAKQQGDGVLVNRINSAVQTINELDEILSLLQGE